MGNDRRSQIEFLWGCQYEDFNLSTVEVWRKPTKTDASDLIACWLNIADPMMMNIPSSVYNNIIDRLNVIENKELLARAAIDTLKVAYPKTWVSMIKSVLRAVPDAREHLAAEVIRRELSG